MTKIGDEKEMTTTLEELCECGFVRAYDNYHTPKNGKFYQVIEPFVLFAESFLKEKQFDTGQSFINTPAYSSWAGHSFEILCLNNIYAIKKALGINGVMTKEYSWKSKKFTPGSQIDLLIQRKDMVINVCGIKYAIGEYTITKEYKENLINKLQTFFDEMKPKNSSC